MEAAAMSVPRARDDELAALDKLRQLEADLEDLYSHFAQLYVEDAEASELFYQLGKEEGAHRRLVEHQIRYVRNRPDAEVRVVLAEEEVEALLEEIGQLRRIQPPPSLGEAVSSAVVFEFVTEEAYVGKVIMDASPTIMALVDRLTKASGRHHALLKEFAERRGYLVYAAGA